MNVRLVPFRREAHLSPTVAVLLRVREADPSYPPPSDVEPGEAHFGEWLMGDEVVSRWVALIGDEVVGHVAVSEAHDYILHFLAQLDDGSAPRSGLREIVKLFVEPRSRGAGVGAALLAHATNAITTDGHLPVLAVVDSSEAARRLYARASMRELGTFAGVHGVNHVFMGQPTPTT